MKNKPMKNNLKFVDANDALYRSIVKGGPSFLKAFLKEDEKNVKKHYATLIASAERKGEVRAYEKVESVVGKYGRVEISRRVGGGLYITQLSYGDEGITLSHNHLYDGDTLPEALEKLPKTQ